jgi:hypothetical protein
MRNEFAIKQLNYFLFLKKFLIFLYQERTENKFLKDLSLESEDVVSLSFFSVGLSFDESRDLSK